RTIFLEHHAHPLCISNVTHLQRPPLNRPPISARKIIIRDRREASSNQHLASVTPDVTSSSCNKYIHMPLFLTNQNWHPLYVATSDQLLKRPHSLRTGGDRYTRLC